MTEDREKFVGRTNAERRSQPTGGNSEAISHHRGETEEFEKIEAVEEREKRRARSVFQANVDRVVFGVAMIEEWSKSVRRNEEERVRIDVQTTVGHCCTGDVQEMDRPSRLFRSHLHKLLDEFIDVERNFRCRDR